MNFLVNDNGVANATNLPAGFVTEAALIDGAVSTPKMAGDAVTLEKIANDAKAALLGPAAAALATVMAETAANRTGAIGSFYLADDFEADTLATKTNSTYDAAGDYYGNPQELPSYSNEGGMGNRLSLGYSIIETMPQGTDPECVIDGDKTDNSIASDMLYWTGGETIGPAYYVQIDFGSGVSKVITEARVIMRDAGANWGSWKWQASNDGTNWTDVSGTVDLSSTVDTPAITSTDTLTGTSGGFRHYRIIGVSGTAPGLSGFNEFEFEIVDYNVPLAQTFAPTPVTLDVANPSDLVAFVVIDPQEAITPGTDIAMTLSIDGGTTDATGTWTKVGDIGASGLELYSVEADVSAQTGSSLTYEITTLNNKEIRLHQLVGIKAFY